MERVYSPAELEATLGDNIKSLRLQRNLTRETLCERAGISLHALKNLESGKGSTLRTLVLVVRALERTEWLGALAPVISINPLTMPRIGESRQRASKRLRSE